MQDLHYKLKCCCEMLITKTCSRMSSVPRYACSLSRILVTTQRRIFNLSASQHCVAGDSSAICQKRRHLIDYSIQSVKMANKKSWDDKIARVCLHCEQITSDQLINEPRSKHERLNRKNTQKEMLTVAFATCPPVVHLQLMFLHW